MGTHKRDPHARWVDACTPRMPNSDLTLALVGFGAVVCLQTTTTERCLFYAKKIRHMGDVDQGDTTMDFMREERERGITIQSACITFNWTKITAETQAAAAAAGKKPSSESEHRINLIDTPGHVDFTQQVEQSLRVLDGAVVVLDGVKGVEAQTVTVWGQAEQQSLARIVFVNKLDRDGANFEAVVESVREKLHTQPIVLTLPLYDEEPSRHGPLKLQGLIDLLEMDAWVWGEPGSLSPQAGLEDTGAVFRIRPLARSEAMYNRAREMREKVVEQVAEVDERIMELYLASDAGAGAEPAEKRISAQELRQALRRITVAQAPPRALPAATAASPASPSSPVAPLSQAYTLVFCGSSKANKGVQFLLNAMVDYLPSPLDKQAIQLEQIGGGAVTSTAAKGAQQGKGKGGKHSKAAGAVDPSTAAAPALAPSSSFLKSVSGDPSKDSLVALAFKVTHDLARGALPIVFVRVYTGAIRKGDALISVSPPESAAQVKEMNKALSSSTSGPAGASPVASPAAPFSPSSSSSLSSLPKERPQKLLEISADNLSAELSFIESGNIGALVGMKTTRTGDTILHSSAAAASAALANAGAGAAKWDAAASAKAGSAGAVDSRIGYLRGITFSEPVFFCSVEAASTSAQVQLDQSLSCLMREDPSVLVSLDPETGQTLIKGMGELHLEIVRSRLLHDFGLGRSSAQGEDLITFGAMKISYREGIGSPLAIEGFRYTAGSLYSGQQLAQAEAECILSLSLVPLEVGSGLEVSIDAPEGSALTAASPTGAALLKSLESGVRDGCNRGPLLGYPLTDLRVEVHGITLSPSASAASLQNSLRGGAARAMGNLMREAVEEGSGALHLLEPVMRCDVQLSSASLGDVLSDLTSKRRAHIIDVGQLSAGGSSSASSSSASSGRSYIHAEVPLASMLGYASVLRSTTQGAGSFSMAFQQFRQMPTHLQNALRDNPP